MSDGEPLGVMLRNLLDSTFTYGFWYGRAPTDVVAPYGVYSYFGPIQVNLAGRANMQNREVQIDCYAGTGDEAGQLANAVEALVEAQNMDASPTMFTATPISRSGGEVDPVTSSRRVMLRYSVWFRQ